MSLDHNPMIEYQDSSTWIPQLEDKVQMWQSSPASSLNVWFSSVPCWSDLVLQALQFLAGETKGKQKWSIKLLLLDLVINTVLVLYLSLHYTVCLTDGMMALPSGFSPFVEFSEESQQWRWIGKKNQLFRFLISKEPDCISDHWSHSLFVGPTQDTEKDLSALCQLWLDSKDLVVKVLWAITRVLFICLKIVYMFTNFFFYKSWNCFFFPSDRNWGHVRDYLTNTKGVSYRTFVDT